MINILVHISISLMDSLFTSFVYTFRDVTTPASHRDCYWKY